MQKETPTPLTAKEDVLTVVQPECNQQAAGSGHDALHPRVPMDPAPRIRSGNAELLQGGQVDFLPHCP